MSLPELLAPEGTPVFLAADHAISLHGLYADVRFRTGHGRKRRVYTSSRREVDVSWFLEADQMAEVDDWFETALDVGDRHFSARVANQGAGFLYWDAQWLTPYLSTPLHLGRWRVTGTLLLIGEGSTEGPANTTAGIEMYARLLAAVSAPADNMGAVEFGAALGTAAMGAVEFGAELLTVELDFMAREDSGYILREDGGRIRREA